MPPAQRLLVWLLLCMLPLQGLAAVLVQGFGALHFHAQALSVAVEDPMQGWRDFRRQVHGEDRHADASQHAHDELQRHHHAAPDAASAVMVDPAAGEAAQTEEAPVSVTGALAQAMGPLGGSAALPTAAAHESWRAALLLPVATRQPVPLERPPRGA